MLLSAIPLLTSSGSVGCKSFDVSVHSTYAYLDVGTLWLECTPLKMEFIAKRPLRSRNNRDVDEDIISEKFLFKIENWANRSNKDGFQLSSECSLCDNNWLITFKGTDYHTDYSSVHITNLSSRRLRASYLITMKNLRSENDITFADPEETVIFEVDEDGDNSWGCDELILSSDLRDNESGFIHDDSIQIEIEIKICGILKSSSTLLSQAIESAKGKSKYSTHDATFHPLVFCVFYNWDDEIPNTCCDKILGYHITLGSIIGLTIRSNTEKLLGRILNLSNMPSEKRGEAWWNRIE